MPADPPIRFPCSWTATRTLSPISLLRSASRSPSHTVGNGSVIRDPDQADYLINDEVELAADPDPGWEFSHWSGDLSGTANPASITMDGNKLVIANFVLLPPDCPEDLDGNGSIDLSDLQILLAAYGSTPGHPAWSPDADFNGDGTVDLSDLQQLLSVYGTVCP